MFKRKPIDMFGTETMCNEAKNSVITPPVRLKVQNVYEFPPPLNKRSCNRIQCVMRTFNLINECFTSF